ncbi:glycoside hydrolase family 43 protein [Phellopilus nigrolimitatus]|nr:glycoside hydrolase family 43 protein [Phellopilus nigrolimitatus]
MRWSSHLALLALAGVCHAYPDPALLSGDTAVHDPTLCRDDSGNYFLFSTGPGVEIRTSTDRIAWTYAGLVWPDGASWTDEYTGTSNGSLWSPSCEYAFGKFHLYYSASTAGSQNSAIFYATSSTGWPGSYTNEGLVTSTSSGDSYNAIDPHSLIFGSLWYLSLGSYGTGIKGVTLSPDTGKPNSTDFTALAERTADSGAIQGSVIYPQGDYFYLFSAWGQCCNGTASTSSIRVGRSSSATGGFVDASGVALTSGGGTPVLETHGAVFGPGGPDLWPEAGGPVLVYHYYTPTGSWLGINALNFSSGWPVAV